MKYKVGDRIRIIRMAGEPQYSGREGVISEEDDIEILELGGKK